MPAIVPLIICIFLLNILYFRTRVDAREIRVRFGALVPLYLRRVPVAQVRYARAITYRPLRDAGGWGIRWGRFEGERTSFLNARGRRGVLVEGDGLRLVIGSARPEELAAAINEARASRR